MNDLECCLKFFNTKKLQSLNLKEKKFGIEVEVMSKAIKNKLNIYEVGVSYNARSYDEGKKIKFIDALDAIICVFKYKFL